MTEVWVATCAGCGPLAVSAEKPDADRIVGEHEAKHFDPKFPKSAAHSVVVVNVQWIASKPSSA